MGSAEGRDRPFLTSHEIADWLGVTPRTVCLWAECSEMPAVRFGRQWRFRRAEVERWIEQSSNTLGIESAVRSLSPAVASALKRRAGNGAR
jgi:excisionase family DNA binding protein